MKELVLGLDVCDEYTQLSCSGTEKNWTLPTVVCRKKAQELWLIGEEAYASALEGDGIIVDKLLTMLLKEGTATIAGIKYKGLELLGYFLEQVLSLPLKEEGKAESLAEQEPQKTPEDDGGREAGEAEAALDASLTTAQITSLVITVPKISAHLMDCLMYCADFLRIPRERVHIVSHTESFLYYVLSQKREVWNNQVGMFDLSEKCLCYYEMKVQRGMRQVTVVAEREKLDEGFSLDILSSPSGKKLADKILCACGERFLQKKLFSSVFLTGKGFDQQDWAVEFMKLVCTRRRVYVEPVLFAQGAAYKAEDLLREKTYYPYVFICDGRLDTTVSVKVLYQDQESQLVLAAAGDSWYESKSTVEIILDHQNYIEFLITPPDPKKKKNVKLTLEGFPEREDKTLRVQMQIGFLDERTMAIVVKDKGFGEFYPSTGATLRQEVML